MKLQRDTITALRKWKNDKNRKPLILQGARQVGKTWLLKEFGRTNFDDVALFNFDENPELKQFFSSTKDVKRIVENLSLVHGKKIDPESTLIIFDEIQECNDALNTLKYFAENAPEYYIACAGSLLGVAMSRGASFPVGKVDFLSIYPLSFMEFLASADNLLYNYVQSIDKIEPLPDIFFNQLLDKFKMYFISGGMPEAVNELLESGDISNVQKILQNILNAYALDFSKHAANNDVTKIGYVWQSIPSQLARDNKKFIYKVVKPGARAREYEDALNWLTNAGLIYRVNQCSKPSLPLSAYDDISAFKIYSLDVGLLRQQSNLAPSAITEGNRLLTEFKGALSENYILTSLVRESENTPRYWTSGNSAEIDFILQVENDIIPIEVKANENVIGKSMTHYRKVFSPSTSVRHSLKNLKIDDGLVNIPLFLADITPRILELIALENRTNEEK
ncbi:MAG: AAA family ATPase [bacterium]